MPKIIENLESRLLEETRRQILENGYAATTIRSVAKGCGVGVGTVYNYFPSKDALVAGYMLGDWKQCIARIREAEETSHTPEPVIRAIYDQLCIFSRRHQRIIGDQTATSSFAGAFRQYHGLLRSQLAQPIRKYCGSDFTSEFIAEALLSWTMEGKEFEEIYGVIKKLF